MAGRHRAPRKPITLARVATAETHSPTLRAPWRERVADTLAVIGNMLSPVPAPPTVDGHTTVPGPAEQFDADR